MTTKPGFHGAIAVRKRKGENWETLQDFTYTANKQTFTVPAGSKTDFASQPRTLAWLIPKAGDSVPAAILHDHLWRKEAPAGRITYREADGILRQALRRRNVPFILRWLAWTAVRWGSLTRPGGTKDWWKDTPLVLTWTLLALPVVLPPAITVAAALIVIQLAETLTWLILKPTTRTKRVNKPTIGTTT